MLLVLVMVLNPTYVLAQGCVDYGDYFHQVGELYLDGEYFNSLTVSGNYAFAPSYDVGLRLFDISDPSNPQSLGSVATSTLKKWLKGKGPFSRTVYRRPISSGS